MTISSGPTDPLPTGEPATPPVPGARERTTIDATSGDTRAIDTRTADTTAGDTTAGDKKAGDKKAGDTAAAEKQRRKVQHSRVGGTWVSLVGGALVLLVLLLFILQNNVDTAFTIFALHFSLPLGVAILLAALAGALIMALVGGLRIIQLRRAYKRG